MSSSQQISNIRDRVSIILVRPEHSENIGLAARCMKNTGFSNLRIIGLERFHEKTYITAVHSHNILEKAMFFQNIGQAVSDLHLVFAASIKQRKNYSFLEFDEVLYKIKEFPENIKIGIMFGTERTGLTSEELSYSNFRFSIPQYSRQPSYNLASAVLLTLFQLAPLSFPQKSIETDSILPKDEQLNCIKRIVNKLETSKFIHDTNRDHVTERLFDLFGRLAMTEKDKNLLLAIFSKHQ